MNVSDKCFSSLQPKLPQTIAVFDPVPKETLNDPHQSKKKSSSTMRDWVRLHLCVEDFPS